MKFKRSVVASFAALALVASACGSDTKTETTEAGSKDAASTETTAAATASEADCGKEEVFCVGLVTDTGKVDDKSFNQSAWEGVEAFGADYTKYIETTDAKDYANNIGQFVEAEYDVIVTVGFLMAEATVTAAKDNPEIKFIGVDQFQGEEVANVTGLIFPEDQAGYAAGYLAGLVTQTNQLGQVLGLQIPPVEKFAKGFEAGAVAANSEAKVFTVYHPDGDNAFNDPVWGADEAKKQLAQNADVIFGAGGNTGNGALGEIAKAEGAGESIWCIGVDSDQWYTVENAQPCLVTSAMKLIAEGVTDLLGQAKGGDIAGGNFVGKTGLAPYHDFDAKLPDDVKTKVADVVKGLADGSIETGVTLGG